MNPQDPLVEDYEPDEIDGDAFEEIKKPSKRTDPYPPIEKKREIISYWRNNGHKRTFDSVRNRYRGLRYEKQLRRWEYQLLEHGLKYYLFCPKRYNMIFIHGPNCRWKSFG